jgi:hypothetical protein
LTDYFKAVTDEAGALKRYLFESNVRDYLGNVQINADIKQTLVRDETPDQGDFWWLNNGVTILATGARVVARDVILDNAQIVNGLQTTETISNYFTNVMTHGDDRSILIKIIVAVDDDMRARIIKATNYQSAIELSYLRGLDTIQRNIEQYLLDHGWFYDRRRNFYLNQGKPADRIITMPYLASAVRAIALGDPARSPQQRSKSLRDDQVYNAVFSSKWDLRIYQVSLEIVRAVEVALHSRRSTWYTAPQAITHLIGFLYVCDLLKKYSYRPEEVATLAGMVPTAEAARNIFEDLVEASKEARPRAKKSRGVVLEKTFIEAYVKKRIMDQNQRSKGVDAIEH